MIQHGLGTTQVPAEPQRIVTLGFADEDALAVLGLKPAGYLGYQRDGIFPWQEGTVDLSGSVDLDDVGADENAALNMEQLAGLAPDLILATGYWQIADQYDQLSAIAPTIGPRTKVGEDTWQDNASLIGEALGRGTDMAARITEAEQRIDAVRDAYPGLQGKTYVDAFNWTERDIVVNADATGATATSLGRLGLTLSPKLSKEINPDGLSGSRARLPLSLERLDLLDADLLIIGYGSDDLEQRMAKNQSFRELSAVREKRVQTLNRDAASASNNPTILNVPWGIEQLRPVLQRVAE